MIASGSLFVFISARIANVWDYFHFLLCVLADGGAVCVPAALFFFFSFLQHHLCTGASQAAVPIRTAACKCRIHRRSIQTWLAKRLRGASRSRAPDDDAPLNSHMIQSQTRARAMCRRTDVTSVFVYVFFFFLRPCSGRSGKIRVQSMKIGLLSLCKGHLEEKYKCEYG